MRKRGDDLGEARSLTEKEDVVRLMTIHSSKGLEFSYVFLAGMGRKFNKMDFNEPYLFDQHFGLAVKAIDADNRITYTSLPFLAMKEKKELEMRAEEMRILYVAMTRAKEHLYMIASVKEIEREIGKWQDAQLIDPMLMLPEYTRSRANGYLDWIGPAVARHTAFGKFGVLPGGQFIDSPSNWVIDAIPFSGVYDVMPEVEEQAEEISTPELDEVAFEEVKRRFDWTYEHSNSVTKRSKQTVSELKRLAILEQSIDEDPFMENGDEVSTAYLHDRPEFMQRRKLSPAEVGTAMHTIMQHIDFQAVQSVETVTELVKQLTDRQLLTTEEAKAIDCHSVARFFTTEIAERLKNAGEVSRELPFTYAHDSGDGDYQILQGIADCLFKESDGWVLLDYKTDRLGNRFGSDAEIEDELQNRYGIQLNLYRNAIESIAKIKIKEMVLYLFEGDKTVQVQEEVV